MNKFLQLRFFSSILMLRTHETVRGSFFTRTKNVLVQFQGPDIWAPRPGAMRVDSIVSLAVGVNNTGDVLQRNSSNAAI
jgi:hypothetical protein